LQAFYTRRARFPLARRVLWAWWARGNPCS
jgi:hypothetical protein